MAIDVSKFDLAELLPHAAPMILLSKMIKLESDAVICKVEISPDSMFFDPLKNSVPAWVGIEYMAQTIGVYAGVQAKMNDRPVKLGFLLGSRRYESAVTEFFNGESLTVSVSPLYQEENGLAGFGCAISINEQRVCEAKLNVFSPENVDTFFRSE